MQTSMMNLVAYNLDIEWMPNIRIEIELTDDLYWIFYRLFSIILKVQNTSSLIKSDHTVFHMSMYNFMWCDSASLFQRFVLNVQVCRHINPLCSVPYFVMERNRKWSLNGRLKCPLRRTPRCNPIWGQVLCVVNTSRPRQNGHIFADDTFKRIFLNKNTRISIEIWLKFVPKGPINNIPELVQIMAWHRSGGNPSSEPMMVSLLTYICVTWPQWVNTLRLSIEAMVIQCTDAYLFYPGSLNWKYGYKYMIPENISPSQSRCLKYIYQI